MASDPADLPIGEKTDVIGNSAGAEPAAGAAAKVAGVKQTCVEDMAAAPDVDGKYVMFANGEYTVFERAGLTIKPTGIKMDAKGARFFRVLPDKTEGGKRKKQRKSSKKQRKSSKKQRKSRGSRRSKK